jgi:pimeloyl-ACP methyl ester carboxylesterase/DNA-binding CsgD family transcriptional regulator
MASTDQQIRFCRSRDGTRIAYATAGDGPALVWAQHWVHHLEWDAGHPVWRHWLAHLCRHHTLVRFDWRGCGLSDRDPGDFTFQRLVEDFEAVVQAAHVERFALFGMAGAGGAVAMTHAAHHPQRVTRLLLHNCHRRGRLAGSVSPDKAQEAEARLKVIALGWPNETPAYGQFFTALHMPDSDAGQMRSYNDLLRKTTSAQTAMALLRTFWTADVTGVVSKVSCPALVTHVRGDGIIPFEEGREVAAAIPGARFLPLESRNHLLLETEPAWQQFVHAVDEFLPGTGPRPAPPFDELTPREREVLQLLAEGLPNKKIGTRLGISEATARNHVSAILGKISVRSRAEAIVRAREAGLGASRPFKP